MACLHNDLGHALVLDCRVCMGGGEEAACLDVLSLEAPSRRLLAGVQLPGDRHPHRVKGWSRGRNLPYKTPLTCIQFRVSLSPVVFSSQIVQLHALGFKVSVD